MKRYTQEIGSDRINFLLTNVPLNRLMCLILGVVELFWICVRKKNDDRITNQNFIQASVNLNSEILDHNSDFKTIPVADSLILNSVSLIEAHSLNSVDALVLQSALDIDTELNNSEERLVLLASDRRLIRAAVAEGLLVFNPETVPTATHKLDY